MKINSSDPITQRRPFPDLGQFNIYARRLQLDFSRTTLVSLILIHTSLLAWGSYTHSPGLDEPAYVASGVAHLQLGRFDVCTVSPPLIRSIAAIPLVLTNSKTDWSRFRDGIQVGDRPEAAIGRGFVLANGYNTFWLFTLARWTLIPFSILGMLVSYRWANELYGANAGLLAATLWCFCPNILASGQQANPDMGMTALAVTAAYTFWIWLRQPNFYRASVAGVALGLAQLAKTNVIILLPLWPILWVIDRLIWSKHPGTRYWMYDFALIAWIGVVSIYTINLGYLFDGSFYRLGNYQFVSHTLGGDGAAKNAPDNRFSNSVIGVLPVPLPKDYVIGIDLQRFDFENTGGGAQTYFRRQLFDHGFWWYYLYVIAIKVPLGTWALAILAIACRFSGHGKVAIAYRQEWAILAPGIALFALASSQTGFNHHLRYVLGAFPFAFIWISSVAGRRSRGIGHRLVAGIIFLLVWAITSSIFVFPHSQSFFNELVGGPTRGHNHVLDSNVDWGQDLLYLKNWIDCHPDAKPIEVVYFGPVRPALAKIDPTPAAANSDKRQKSATNTSNSLEPHPGWFAISLEALMGGNFWYRGDHRYFQNFSPIDRAGYSICIYHLSIDDVNRIRAEHGYPVLPLDAE